MSILVLCIVFGLLFIDGMVALVLIVLVIADRLDRRRERRSFSMTPVIPFGARGGYPSSDRSAHDLTPPPVGPASGAR